MSEDSSNNISATALAIALFSLVVAVGQIVQQYFATADGARRCQASVIGPWHRETHWHFRWRELRFEILYKSPHIMMAKGTSDFNALRGLPLLSQSTQAPDYDEKADDAELESDELVCWVPLLEELLQLEANYRDKTSGEGEVEVDRPLCSPVPFAPPSPPDRKEYEQLPWYPVVKIKPHTWDLVP